MSDKEAEKAAAEAKAKAEADEKKAAEEKAKAEKAAAEAKAKAERSTFHVPGPGSVTFGGKAYPPGSTLRLTDEEAESLGVSVKPGKAPPPPEDAAKRTAGRYRVAGPGSVWVSGKPREKGFEFDCGEDEARSLGAAIERVK